MKFTPSVGFFTISHLAPEAFEGTIWDFTHKMATLIINN